MQNTCPVWRMGNLHSLAAYSAKAHSRMIFYRQRQRTTDFRTAVDQTHLPHFGRPTPRTVASSPNRVTIHLPTLPTRVAGPAGHARTASSSASSIGGFTVRSHGRGRLDPSAVAAVPFGNGHRDSSKAEPPPPTCSDPTGCSADTVAGQSTSPPTSSAAAASFRGCGPRYRLLHGQSSAQFPVPELAYKSAGTAFRSPYRQAPRKRPSPPIRNDLYRLRYRCPIPRCPPEVPCAIRFHLAWVVASHFMNCLGSPTLAGEEAVRSTGRLPPGVVANLGMHQQLHPPLVPYQRPSQHRLERREAGVAYW